MRAYSKVSTAVSKAEFPDFDICSAFQVFGRDMVLAAPSVPDVARLSEEAKRQLAKLEVTEIDLKNQYAQYEIGRAHV